MKINKTSNIKKNLRIEVAIRSYRSLIKLLTLEETHFRENMRIKMAIDHIRSDTDWVRYVSSQKFITLNSIYLLNRSKIYI